MDSTVAAVLHRLRASGAAEPLTDLPDRVEALHRLHRRFVEVVPYENLDIVLGRPAGIDPATSLAAIRSGRGGYCYHLNGAFARLLEELGYPVTRHVGGVQGPNGCPHVNGNHLALTVRAGGKDWIVDVGLSDCLYEPLPLAVGEYRQGPFSYRVDRSEASPGGWRVRHDTKGSFVAMDFAAAPARQEDFAGMHAHLSRDPRSPFVRTLCVARRIEAGADVLRSLTLATVRDDVTRTVLDRREDWFAALGDVFGLARTLWSRADQDNLWAIAVEQHAAFLASRRARREASQL
ncbi:MAG TPA: arylamine N-acetyltransferase [Dermatophilaceae bacterium]|nr:arylamine N-acetyltransferase [Dermatophilaceae bacterium]